MRFRRAYPGSYRATARTTVILASGKAVSTLVDVEVYRVDPRLGGEPGRPWWRVEVVWPQGDTQQVLSSGGDIWAPTLREAKALAEDAVRVGWAAYPGIGMCLRTPGYDARG